MNKLNNDILIRIINIINDEEKKKISELEEEVKKTKLKLEKEKLKIDNIKNSNSFDLTNFCCDFCCEVYNNNDEGKISKILDEYICKYCEKKKKYKEDILNATIIYIIWDLNYNNLYSKYNEIPIRYRKNEIFTIKKYYYDDLNMLIDDCDSYETHYENSKMNIIQKGLDLSFDYRNERDFKLKLKKQKKIICG